MPRRADPRRSVSSPGLRSFVSCAPTVTSVTDAVKHSSRQAFVRAHIPVLSPVQPSKASGMVSLVVTDSIDTGRFIRERVRRLLLRYDDGRVRTAADSAGRVREATRTRAPPRIDHARRASYSAARKPRGGSGTVSASARRALPLKRRSGQMPVARRHSSPDGLSGQKVGSGRRSASGCHTGTQVPCGDAACVDRRSQASPGVDNRGRTALGATRIECHQFGTSGLSYRGVALAYASRREHSDWLRFVPGRVTLCDAV